MSTLPRPFIIVNRLENLIQYCLQIHKSRVWPKNMNLKLSSMMLKRPSIITTCNWIDPDFDLNINWYGTLVFLHFAQQTIHYLHWARKTDPVLVAIESITWWQIKYQSVSPTLYHHLELFCHRKFAIVIAASLIDPHSLLKLKLQMLTKDIMC